MVGFLSDTPRPCPTSAEGATFLQELGVLPRKILKSQSRMVAFGGVCGTTSEAMCMQLRICVQGATPLWSSIDLSGPLVVQHHRHVTLTLDFQGQIFKILYPRNGRADRHETKGIWVDRVLYLLYDLELWHWLCIFKVKFENAVSQEWEGQLTWNQRDVSQ